MAVPAHVFHIMVPAHFFHITIPAHFSNRWQKYERTIRAQFYERKTRSSIFWKFLGNHIMEISWKLYAGEFLETMCCEIWVDAGGFFDGGNYGPVQKYGCRL